MLRGKLVMLAAGLAIGLAAPAWAQTEVKMILTTPFCPYAGSMIQQVKEQVESVVENDVKITLLAERWDPRDAGLMW